MKVLPVTKTNKNGLEIVSKTDFLLQELLPEDPFFQMMQKAACMYLFLGKDFTTFSYKTVQDGRPVCFSPCGEEYRFVEYDPWGNKDTNNQTISYGFRYRLKPSREFRVGEEGVLLRALALCAKFPFVNKEESSTKHIFNIRHDQIEERGNELVQKGQIVFHLTPQQKFQYCDPDSGLLMNAADELAFMFFGGNWMMKRIRRPKDQRTCSQKPHSELDLAMESIKSGNQAVFSTLAEMLGREIGYIKGSLGKI